MNDDALRAYETEQESRQRKWVKRAVIGTAVGLVITTLIIAAYYYFLIRYINGLAK